MIRTPTPVLAVALLATLGAPARAQAPAFHHRVPEARAMVIRKDLPYMSAGGKDVLMDLYRPASARAGMRLPVLIFLNTIADRPQRDHPIYVGWASAATARGLAAINPAAAPVFAEGLDRLLAHLRANADRLGVDPDRVAVYAASGNAYGALPVLQDPARTGIHAAVLYYGGEPVPRLRRDLPMLVVRAGLDRPGLNEGLDRLIGQAMRENAPVEVINYAGGHHAFEMIDDNDATRAVIDATFDFVTAALDPGHRSALRAGIPEARAAGAVQSGDFATAASVYGELVAGRPGDSRLKLAYGEALLGAGRFREARAQFDALKDAGLGYRDLGLPAARAAMADGDADGAIAWLKTIPRRFLPADVADEPAFAAVRDRPDFRELFR